MSIINKFYSNQMIPQKMTENEVNHIKQGVLKYINVQLMSKGRDKYNTADPKSPYRATSPKVPNKNSRAWALQSSTPSQANKKNSKASSPLSASSKVVPNSRDKNDKKISGVSNEESLETPPQLVPLELKANQNKSQGNESLECVETSKEETPIEMPVTLQGNEKLFDESISKNYVDKLVKYVLDDGLPPIIEEKSNYPEDSKTKENDQILKHESRTENKEYIIEFNKTKKKQPQITRVDTEAVLSVSELAKKYGQTTITKQKPQKNYQNEEEDISHSLASFGGPDKRRRPQKKATIGQFLGLSNETQDQFQTRKRSYTEDQPMDQPLFRTFKDNFSSNQKFNSQQDKKSFKTAEFESAKNTSDHERKKQIKKVEIVFTEQQQNVLKSKYNNLLLKLDKLKQKVQQETKNQIKPKQYDTNKFSQRKRQAQMLYNKYSPLKKLQRIRRQKNLAKPRELSSMRKSKEISFENSFEDDRSVPTFKRILNLEVP